MVLTSSLSILWISSMETVAIESSLTSFTPLGLTFGILLMSSTTFSVLPLRKSIMLLSVLMISFSLLLMVYSNLMLFLGSLVWCLYLLIFLKFWLSFLGLFQPLLFQNESLCLEGTECAVCVALGLVIATIGWVPEGNVMAMISCASCRVAAPILSASAGPEIIWFIGFMVGLGYVWNWACCL